jgi:hypothetical protein
MQEFLAYLQRDGRVATRLWRADGDGSPAFFFQCNDGSRSSLLSRIISPMNEKETAGKPCTSDRSQRRFCRYFNERTGLCGNPGTATGGPPARPEDVDKASVKRSDGDE